MSTGTKLYVPLVFLSINDSNKFKENLKQGFKRKKSSTKYRFEITTKPKNKNLDYMIDPTLIDCSLNRSKPVKMMLQEILLICITAHK